MSFLYPLFLAGIAAVALPILLHLIRRHTRERVPFSSLMFLRTTIPRFRSRSSLEHVLLLILRCLVLCLLAFAFARPFLRRPAAASPAGLGKRVVLLIDTSASMRRADLWTRALDEAKSVLADTGPADRLCVMSFDQGTRTLIGFEQWAAMEPAQRASVVTQDLARLSPGWARTNLGQALVTAAEALEDEEANDRQQPVGARRIVLVSDLQQGSNLDALLAYEWPQGMELAVKTIPCRGVTNASLQWVTNRDPLGSSRNDKSLSIRISNSPDAAHDRFQLHWADDTSRTVDVYAPAGHSSIVHPPVPPGEPAAMKLVLTGDDHDFDNTLYLAPALQQQVTVLYIGSDDPNDTREMLFYLRQAFGADRALVSHVVSHPGSAPLSTADVETAHLVIVADAISEQSIASLRRYVESGKTLLLVMKSAETAVALSGLAGIGSLESQEAGVERYAMLDRIEYNHPLLRPFSDPRFGDFTRIHFWKYRRIDISGIPAARVLASFDSDDPAWFEVPVGRGSLLVWTSGWHPADSDLALSSKFVPLLYCALEYGGTLAERQSQYFVGDPVSLPSGTSSTATDIQVRKPDNSLVRPDADQRAFTQTDLPGIYSVADLGLRIADSARGAGPKLFAVNLPAEESRTDPMPLEDIEKLGVSLESTSRPRAELASANPQSAIQNPQLKAEFWRWVLLATLIMLLVETWLGGWFTSEDRKQTTEDRKQTTEDSGRMVGDEEHLRPLPSVLRSPDKEEQT